MSRVYLLEKCKNNRVLARLGASINTMKQKSKQNGKRKSAKRMENRKTL